LKKIPSTSCQVFRGINVSEEKAQELKEAYSEEKIIQWSAYSSASLDKDTALKFSKGKQPRSVLMIIDLICGKLIQAYSVYRQEREVLLSPNARFQVTKCAQIEGLLTITLNQIDDGPCF